MAHYIRLEELVSSRQAQVMIMGQGYVGLPLALATVKAGFRTFGYDLCRTKIDSLKRAESYVTDVSNQELKTALDSGLFSPVNDPEFLAQADVVIVCVPTPLSKTREPDLSCIMDSVKEIKSRARPAQLIILESTTYPGTTDEVLVSQLSTSAFQVGKEFFACFSPERVDPGNTTFHTINTPKVIGGVTPRCTQLGTLFYQQVMESIIPVSSARVAETVKLLENTFRAVNIGLINELALMAERMNIDIWEVIAAASTKPFGFMPFYPGPGIGGHCIPLDPHYLAWKARSFDFHNRFIDLAADVNDNMPRHVVARAAEALNLASKPLSGSKILILGAAYKKNVGDHRESPAIEIFRHLRNSGADVHYSDPLVPSFDLEGEVFLSQDLSPELVSEADLVIGATAHQAYDRRMIASSARLILDCRNMFSEFQQPNIFKLGAPFPKRNEFMQGLAVVEKAESTISAS